MAKNWDVYYQKQFDSILKREAKEWEQYKKKHKELQDWVQINNFLKIKNIDRKELLEKIVDFKGESIYEMESGGYNLLKNPYKEWLTKEFSSSHSKYSKTPIKFFVEREIPKLKATFQKRFDNPNGQKDFPFEPEFLQANEETILNFIAEYNAREKAMDAVRGRDIDAQMRFLTVGNLKIEDEKEKTDSKGLTIAQLVIIFGLLNEQNKLSYHQDLIRFAQFISKITSKNEQNVRTMLSTYVNDTKNGYIQKSEKQNLTDYETVKDLFQAIENQAIVNKIDGRIDKLKKQMKNL